MAYITLSTAVSITGLSKRTLWRRIAEGLLQAQAGADQGEQARVWVEDVMRLARLQLEPDDRALIVEADQGVAEAQCDLGLLCLMQNQPAEAVHWLNLAAQQQYPEAMLQLGRCHLAGVGVAVNEAAGMEWISRAAALGHAIAKPLARYLMDPDRPALPPAELEAQLEAIEQRVVAAAVGELNLPV